MKDEEVAAAVTVVADPVKVETTTTDKKEVVTPVVANANSDQLIAVNAELSALKGQLNGVISLLNDLGGVEKVRDILQTTHANLQAMAANANREKTMLINQLIGNARCAFRKVDLEKFDIEALSKLAQSLQPADYSARGFSANRLPEAEELMTLDELNKEKVK